MPGDEGPAPCCHQHADDTTLHAASPADIATLVQHAVESFCAASAASARVKVWGWDLLAAWRA
jgi:hypothetical protein